jgi:hypothetical protein
MIRLIGRRVIARPEAFNLANACSACQITDGLGDDVNEWSRYAPEVLKRTLNLD